MFISACTAVPLSAPCGIHVCRTKKLFTRCGITRRTSEPEQRLHVFDSTDSFGGTMDKKTKKQKEKIKHRAINWKLVSEFCRGTAGHFILGTLGIVFAALSAYCIPLKLYHRLCSHRLCRRRVQRRHCGCPLDRTPYRFNRRNPFS